MDYKELVERLRKEDERGHNAIFVPKYCDAKTALAGAFLNTVLQKEGLFSDVKNRTYQEPRMYVGETDKSFNERLARFEEKMNERRKGFIVLGNEGNITPHELYDMLKDSTLSFMPEYMKEKFIDPIEADATKDHSEKTQFSQLFDSLNGTKKEVIGNTADYNYWNSTQLMEQAIDQRSEVQDEVDKFQFMIARPGIEEEINNTRNEIRVEVTEMDGVKALAIPADIARIHFPHENTYGMTENDNVIIAMLDDKEIEDIGLTEQISPVNDDGGQQIYNAEGDNITMTIHSITDAWAKSQINDAIQEAKPFTRNDISFKVVALDQVGGFYEDIAKSAEGTDIVGYTYQQNGKFIFKPIHQEGFNLEIPEKWKEGDFPDQVEQCNKNGLSVTFKTEEAFKQGMEIMLDEMGLNTELEVDRYEEDLEAENADERENEAEEIRQDEEDIEL